MNSIHAISFNTSIDLRMSIASFEEGTVIRSLHYSEDAAGKALNAARTIAALGKHVNLWGFAGISDVQRFCNLSEYIHSHIIGVNGETRRNVTLVKNDGSLICHIQNPGYTVNQDQFAILEQQISEQIVTGHFLLFAGSLPPGISISEFNRILKRFKRLGATIVVDADGSLLSRLDLESVYMVKPNFQEITQLAGRELQGFEDIATVAVNCIKAPYTVVSLGSRGALWIDRQHRSYRHGFVESVKPIIVGDVIGCGDSMLGAIIVGITNAFNDLEAFKMGLCAGHAQLFSSQPGRIDLTRFSEALRFVQVSPAVPIRS